jgi:hypothetical protein
MIMGEHSSAANRTSARPAPTGGRIVRISTALGTFVVEIVNDLGSVADPLTADVERGVVECLRAHRHLAREMDTLEIQRGDLDYEVVDL